MTHLLISDNLCLCTINSPYKSLNFQLLKRLEKNYYLKKTKLNVCICLSIHKIKNNLQLKEIHIVYFSIVEASNKDVQQSNVLLYGARVNDVTIQ